MGIGELRRVWFSFSAGIAETGRVALLLFRLGALLGRTGCFSGKAWMLPIIVGFGSGESSAEFVFDIELGRLFPSREGGGSGGGPMRVSDARLLGRTPSLPREFGGESVR
jgi:hypothetical protein